MKRLLTGAALSCLLATSSLAQTATGTGVGVAESNSQSGSIAIAGSGGHGGRGGRASSALTINNPASTTAQINSNSRVENTGTSTVKNVPAVFAPGLSAAGLETCLGSVSGGGAAVGFGASFGTTVPDPGCNARLDARTLWSFGLRGAALARLCQGIDIYNSMPDICARYMPVRAQPTYGVFAPAVLTARATMEPADGPMDVVMKSTGQIRSCSIYDPVRERCKAFADAPRKPTRLASAHPPKPHKTAVAPSTAAKPVKMDAPVDTGKPPETPVAETK